jgi:hypothetical protein
MNTQLQKTSTAKAKIKSAAQASCKTMFGGVNDSFCACCNEPGADFDCNGLKFCDAECGTKYLEQDLEFVEVVMRKTKSDEIPNGTKGYVVGLLDGLNRVHFDNGKTAYCYRDEIEILQE